jgi:dihydropyrimidinase
MAATLITGGRIVTAEGEFDADILVEDGKVRMLGQGLPVPDGVEVHDASGLLVMPGAIDVHTHLDWEFGSARSVDTFGTGTMAAAFGGTTSVIDFANQSYGLSPLAGLEDWHRRCESRCVDVGAHMIILDPTPQALGDLRTLAHDEGVTSFKLFMAYPNVLMVDDGVCFHVMREAARLGAVVCVHAENGYAINILVEDAVRAGNLAPRYHYLTRPPELEGEATARAIALAEYAGAPLYVVHVTCGQALEPIARAKDRSDLIHGETCTQYLFLTSRELERPGFEGAKYVFTPPLRDERHQRLLWDGLRTGDLSVVSTDHCPFCFEEQPFGMKFSKRQGEREGFHKIPNGGPGIEHRIPALFDGAVKKRGMSRSRFVELVATNPARLFGLYPRKGTIAIGSDADLVLFDPDEKWTIRAAEQHSRVDYTLFEGFEVEGRVKKTFLRGQLIVDGERWLGREGMGEFLKRGESGRL